METRKWRQKGDTRISVQGNPHTLQSLEAPNQGKWSTSPVSSLHRIQTETFCGDPNVSSPFHIISTTLQSAFHSDGSISNQTTV